MKSLFVPEAGSASVSFVDIMSGEIVHSISLDAGVYPLATIQRYNPGGCYPHFEGGTVRCQHGNGLTCLPEGQFESAANPFFTVTPAQREARRLGMVMRRTEALATRAEEALEAAQRASRRVPRIEDLTEGEGDAEVSAS